MCVSGSLLREEAEEEARDLGQAASPRIHGRRYATRPWPPLTLGSPPAACHLARSAGKHLGNPHACSSSRLLRPVASIARPLLGVDKRHRQKYAVMKNAGVDGSDEKKPSTCRKTESERIVLITQKGARWALFIKRATEKKRAHVQAVSWENSASAGVGRRQ